MLNSESQLVLDMYEALKESVPSKNREDFAIKMLKTFEDYLAFSEEDILGEDKHLDSAVESLYDTAIEDPFEEEE